MPNQVTSAGLSIKTVSEIIESITAGMQAIYGYDINVSQNTPDGQLINIFAQAAADNLELLQDVYNSFSVDSAYGTVLDQRVALNGLARKAGTYTMQPVQITVDRALTLSGLDAQINNPDGTGFTVADDAGNQFILAATQVIAAAGTYTYSFRAKEVGAIETTPNTITNQVTVTLGVTAVNNPSSATVFGEDEETDVELKIRHAKSFALASVGPADAVRAAILELEGVTDAFVAENDTAAEVNDVPAHSIWCIVEGGEDADIGRAIYAKKIPGCGQKGSQTVVITRPAGNTFTAKFDRPTEEDLYIEFTLIPKRSGVTFDPTGIKEDLVEALRYKLGQTATIGDVVVAMLAIAPDGIVTDAGVSADDITFTDLVNPTSYQHKFVADTTRIEITV